MNADDDRPIIHRIHISLLRPNLIMGCEPVAFAFLFFLVIMLVVVFKTVFAIIIAAIIAGGGLTSLRILNKHDPQAIAVLFRHFGYQNEYPALPSPAARPPKATPWPR